MEASSLNAKWKAFERKAFSQVDGSSLAVFRIVFGLAVAVYAIKAIALGEVRGIYMDPSSHFSYWGFSWVRPWPGTGMFIHFIVLAFSGGLVAAGIAYRAATVVMALLFSFIFLCDRTAYLNHMYLILLLCWMMTVIPADQVASVDGINQRGRQRTIPLWSLWLVQFHVALPYFFGGVAKLNSDWLQGQPMRMTLSQQPWFESFASAVGGETIVYLFSIGGLIFDLVVVPALLWPKTRLSAFCIAFLFHFTNSFVFPIGVFPWLMMGATTIFFSPDWPRRLFSKLQSQPESISVDTVAIRPKVLVGLVAYMLFHCLLPLRHYAFDSNPNWTERGHFYAWHMMLRGKRCGLRMYVTDPASGRTWAADLRRYVTAYQYPKVSRDPEHIRQLAHIIAEREEGENLEVRAFSLVSLNGRKPEILVDPTVDLASQDPSWASPGWIRELSNPLLKHHWDVPLLEWETALELDATSLIRGHRPARQITDAPDKSRITETSEASGVSMTRSAETLSHG